jgi:hypothetical protein
MPHNRPKLHKQPVPDGQKDAAFGLRLLFFPARPQLYADLARIRQIVSPAPFSLPRYCANLQ